MKIETEEQAYALLVRGTRCEKAQDWLGAVCNYEQALSLSPEHPLTRYFGDNNLAYSLVQLARFDEAVWHAELAIETDAQRHNAHKNLGLALQGLGRYADAARCLATAARTEPRDPRALMHLRALLEVHPELVDEAGELHEIFERIRDRVPDMRS